MNTNLRDQDIGNTKDKIKEYGSAVYREGEKQFKEVVGEVQKNVKETIDQRKEQLQQVVSTVDKQVRSNPWPVVAGVAASCLLLGFIMGTSRR